MLASQWSLECNNHVPWLTFRSARDADCCKPNGGCGKGSEISCSAADKPELLPWRSRLKGYRLGSRIFHGRESTDEEHPGEPAATSSTRVPP